MRTLLKLFFPFLVFVFFRNFGIEAHVVWYGTYGTLASFVKHSIRSISSRLKFLQLEQATVLVGIGILLLLESSALKSLGFDFLRGRGFWVTAYTTYDI